MEFNEVKTYIDKIKDSDRFKKLDEFIKMTQIKPNKDMYENIAYYVSRFHPIRNIKEFFQPDYPYFIKFLEYYLDNQPVQMPLREDGYIDLINTLYLVQPGIFSGNKGNFLDHYMMMTDGSIYISKLPLNYRGNSKSSDSYCMYNPLIASYIANTLGVECVKVYLGKVHNGYVRILSKNFLRENEEIVTYTKDEKLISTYLSKMEEALRYRKFNESEIEQVKFEFIKQEFVSKLIGLKDQTAENSPLIVSIDQEGNKHVRMAPMFDLDYSFQTAKDMDNMIVRKCDNGKNDIGSLIEQYKDYPGFEQFVKESIETLDMKEVFKQIYEDTGIKHFETYSDDEQMKEFMNFVTGNIQIAKEKFAQLFKSEREDR